MTELRILELLTNDAITNKHFPKLYPNCMQIVSKSITDFLYDSLITNCVSQTTRLDLLMLLRKCFIRPQHNFKIDFTNYDCLIKSILESKVTFKTDNDLYPVIEFDKSGIKQVDIISEITEYFTKQQELHTKEVRLKEMVRSRDQIKCGNINGSYSNQLFTSRASELCSTMERLEMLKNEKSCREIKKVAETKKENCSVSETKEKLREKDIQMAYSLLNLNKSANGFLLLSNILKNISCYEKLFPYEIEFINYLWDNWETSQVPPEVIIILLESFSFLYEGKIVRLCTIVLEENETDLPATIDYIKKILILSKNNKKLLNNMKTIFYELFSYSGYNNKLLKYIDLFENITE